MTSATYLLAVRGGGPLAYACRVAIGRRLPWMIRDYPRGSSRA
jgi:hypothetical protein